MRVTLLLGSNEGERERILAVARGMLKDSVGNILLQSAVYESDPYGYRSDNRYLNQALVMEVDMSPLELLDGVQGIENHLGRVRSQKERYTDRTIDIDILYCGDKVVESDRLTVPHPRIAERRFVLEPMMEIAPLQIDPKTGLTIRQMWEKIDKKR